MPCRVRRCLLGALRCPTHTFYIGTKLGLLDARVAYIKGKNRLTKASNQDRSGLLCGYVERSPGEEILEQNATGSHDRPYGKGGVRWGTAERDVGRVDRKERRVEETKERPQILFV